MTYVLESELVKDLERLLVGTNNPFSWLKIGFEFDYRAGRVDVVAVNEFGELISFEAKLHRWRQAIHQAYRCTSFSHYSYVVLPEKEARKAAQYSHEFERRGIGLCSVGAAAITVEIEAAKNNPLQPWLTDSAIEHIRQ